VYATLKPKKLTFLDLSRAASYKLTPCVYLGVYVYVYIDTYIKLLILQDTRMTCRQLPPIKRVYDVLTGTKLRPVAGDGVSVFFVQVL